MYTTHGYMTPEDLADQQALTDTGPHPHCPGHEDFGGERFRCTAADFCPGYLRPSRTGTLRRQEIYSRSGRPLTPRQRRRLVKKAGRDPYATVAQDDGMGFPPAMRGYREVVSTGMRPVSGIPAHR